MTVPARALRVRRAAAAVLVVQLAMVAVACSDGEGDAGVPSPAPSASDTTGSTSTSQTSDPADESVLAGTWGGDGAIFSFSNEGLVAMFECATGEARGPVRVDGDGRFEVRGWYALDPGGPGTASEPPASKIDATYSGTRSQDQLEVLVELDDGVSHGPFLVTQGADGALERCV